MAQPVVTMTDDYIATFNPPGPVQRLLLEGPVLSCRGALGQGRSADNSPFFLHGCEGSCCATQGSRWSARSAARTNDLEDGGEQQDDPAARRRRITP